MNHREHNRPARSYQMVACVRFSVHTANFLILLLLCLIPASLTGQQSHEIFTVQPGSISGTVTDKDGALIADVRVVLMKDGAQIRQTSSDSNGYFIFTGIAPGSFQITFTSTGFAPQQQSATLQAGENHVMPPIMLAIGSTIVDVEVTLKPEEVAEEQIKVEEKQRVLGVFPNFYVSYVPNAVALTPRQKFELAWKSIVDPVSFGLTGAIAGFEQADNAYGGYGTGAQGYAKRFGAAYGDFVSSTFLGGAILPSLLKQDPRYFYKGTGTRKSRILYAVANAVICKGDNGRWQPAYSGILGGLAASSISNLYYPAADRNGARLTLENTGIGMGASAAANVIQEFLIPRLTPHVRDKDPSDGN
ncbi:MAG TPA: carboxypeptidase-like regulatory domain-containing protein [Candidatus Sulfotelmatobacter sp.]